jgi:tetratricopeptide (TPR) repeat protein
MRKRPNLNYYLGALVSLIVFLVYLPALQNGFVNWDDNKYVYDNPNIRSLDGRFFEWIFGFHASNWHPLTWISHATDYALWALNPSGHHLSSIILHSLNTFLVALLIFRIIYNAKLLSAGKASDRESQYRTALTASVIAASLFGLHPLHVESVAWISERKDVLCTFFALLSLIMYVQFVVREEQYERRYYLAGFFFFALALMSKPMAVTLPAIFMLMDIYPFGRFSFRMTRENMTILGEKVPFIILSLVSTVLTVMAQRTGGAIEPFAAYPLGTRILVASKAVVFYLSKMIFPAGLSPYYPYPKNVSLFPLEFAAPVLFFLAISILCVIAWKKGKKVFLAVWVYYLVTLLPVIGIVQIGQQAAADRYTYIPSIGIFLLAGLGVSAGIEKIHSRFPALFGGRRTALALPVILIISLMGVLTIHQISIWKDSLTLWNAELRRFPGVYTAYVSRGLAYSDMGDYNRAISDFGQAIGLKPDNPLLYMNRGAIRKKIRDYAHALEDYNTAVKLDPWLTPVYYDRGSLFLATGNYERALADFDTVIRLTPRDAEAYYNRGIAYRQLGAYNQAVRDFQLAARLGYRSSQY